MKEGLTLQEMEMAFQILEKAQTLEPMQIRLLLPKLVPKALRKLTTNQWKNLEEMLLELNLQKEESQIH